MRLHSRSALAVTLLASLQLASASPRVEPSYGSDASRTDGVYHGQGPYHSKGPFPGNGKYGARPYPRDNGEEDGDEEDGDKEGGDKEEGGEEEGGEEEGSKEEGSGEEGGEEEGSKEEDSKEEGSGEEGGEEEGGEEEGNGEQGPGVIQGPGHQNGTSPGGEDDDGPRLNLDDPRFRNFNKLTGRARSGCPGLNSMANHGFLPNNGEKINAVDIVRACFFALGMSPETCSIIILSGLIDSNSPLDLVFPLRAVNLKSWGVAHDCSMTRKDSPHSARSDDGEFDGRIWDVTLSAMKKCQTDGWVNARCFGLGRAARIKDQRRLTPDTVYDAPAAAHGAVEVARTLLTMGNRRQGARLDFIEELFVNERLPWDKGWRPKPYVAGVLDVLDIAAISQTGDVQTLALTPQGAVANSIDVIKVLKSKRIDFLQQVKELCVRAGFRKKSIFENLVTLNHQVRSNVGSVRETLIDESIN